MNKNIYLMIVVSVLLCSSRELFSMQASEQCFPFGRHWIKVVNNTSNTFARIDFLFDLDRHFVRWIGPIKPGDTTLVTGRLDRAKNITIIVHALNKQFTKVGPLKLDAQTVYLSLQSLGDRRYIKVFRKPLPNFYETSIDQQ